MSLGDRVAKCMKEKGWSEGELSRLSGVNQPTIHRIITGQSRDPRQGNVEKIAKALRVSHEWLRSGKGDVKKLPELAPASAPQAHRLAPLINWVQAGAWTSIENSPINWDEVEKYPLFPGCSDSTFVLRVRGESMIDKYPQGALIYVDPEAAPKSGDDVVVYCSGSDDTGEATFKQYILEPGMGPMLKARNSLWSNPYVPLTADCRIIGVVKAYTVIA